MRDIVLFIAFFVGIGYALRRPHIGVLVWSILSYMNPHRLTWGPAYSFPFVYIAALVTAVSYVLNDDKKRLYVSGVLVVWILFILWISVTTIFALEPNDAWEQYIKVIKIQVMVFMTLLLFQDKKRIDQLVWVIFISIGFYGIKGGVFTILTGGQFIVWGPAGSFIEDNNELAVATLMTVPLAYYLMKISHNKWVRRGLVIGALLMLVSVIGSQSRGAFLAIMSVGFYFWWKSKNKLVISMIVLIFVIGMASFIPEHWYQRMETIQNYEQDPSAMGRIKAWTLAYHIANSRFLGGGLNAWSVETYAAYSPVYRPGDTAWVAHSIYFSVLGEHGWIGLLLFLSVYFMAWRGLSRIMRKTRSIREKQWMYDLSLVLKVSLVAYATGGAFLSLSYFDLPWHIVSIVVLLLSMLKAEELEKRKKGETAIEIEKTAKVGS